MPRRPRIVIPNIPHHVTQRGNFQQAVFQDDDDYRTYCRLMNRYSREHNMPVMAFCLMGNHVHFIAVPPTRSTLARVFHAVHTRYARYSNERRQKRGHLWQGRFYSCPMDETHLCRAIRYVERNPVRACLVAHPWDYKWSSAAAHARNAKSPMEVADLVPGKDTSGWRDYLQYPDTILEDEIRRGTCKGLPVGTDAFIEKLESALGQVLTPQRPGRPKG